MDPETPPNLTWPLIFLLVLIFVNLLFLDVKEIVNFKNKPDQKTTEETKIIPTISLPVPTASETCPQSCTAQIKQVSDTIQLLTEASKINEPVPTATPEAKVKEYYIPIGSGNTSLDDWDDVPGLQVYIDPRKYPNIKSIVFEAGVHVPTLNQWVSIRLYNVTDKTPVWSSEVLFPGGSSPTLLVSQSLNLDASNKLYKIQMKTQLKYQAFLDFSRIRITVD